MKLKIEDKVYVKAKNCSGIIKYIGNLFDLNGTFYGISLNKPLGKNSGNFKKKQYFKCKVNHGIFVRSQNLKKIEQRINDENQRNEQENILEYQAEVKNELMTRDFIKTKDFNVTHLPILCSDKNQRGLIAYGATDHYPYIFDTLTLTLKKPNFASRMGHREWITSVSWSKNGRSLYTAGMKGVICCWNESLTCRSETQIHSGSISKIKVLDDSNLMSSSYDNSLKIIDIAEADRVSVTETLTGHSDCVTDFQPINDFSTVSVSRGGEYRAWDHTKPKSIYSYNKFKGQISALAVNDFLGFAGDQGGWLKVFDHRQEMPIFQIKKHEQAITAIATYGNIDKLSVITVSADLTVKLSDLRDGFKKTVHQNTVKDFPYTAKHNEDKLYISDSQGNFYCFATKDLNLIAASKATVAASRCIDFAEKEIIVAGDDGKVSIIT